STKHKAITTAATTVTPISTRPKAKRIVFYDQEEQVPASKLIVSLAQPLSKEKGKGKMVEPEPEKKTGRKTQIQLDEELAFKMHAEEQAKLKRMQRERVAQEEASRAVIIEELDSIHAMIESDEQLATRLQAEEQEQFSIEEKSKMLVEMIAERKKFFAVQRAAEQRSKPPTKAQIRNRMCTYLKNMGGYKHNQLKGRKVVKGSETRTEEISKRTEDELESDKSKKQKIDENVEVEVDDEAEKKRHMELVPDDEMLQTINIEDLETLWKLVKAKHRNTRPEDGYERVLRGDLKVMFEPDVESAVWRELQRYKIQKMNIKFMGGLLGLKDFKMILRVTAAQLILLVLSYNCWVITTAGRVYADRDEIKDLSEKR
ncbi:hypothetical protein Tco_1423820, partial [Tanacetum coccineum]